MLSVGASVVPLLLGFLFLILSCGSSSGNDVCSSYGRCGGHNISHPFRLKDSPLQCGGYMRYTLSCEKNEQLLLYWSSRKFIVQSINYSNYSIRLVDANIHNSSSSSISLPPYSLAFFNFSRDEDAYGLYLGDSTENQIMLYLKCPYENEMVESSDGDDKASSATCVNGSLARGSSWYVVNGDSSVGGLGVGDECRIEWMYPTAFDPNANHSLVSCTHIRNMLLYGFQLYWTSCKHLSYYYERDHHNYVLCDDMGQLSTAELILAYLYYFPIPSLVIIAFYISGRFVLFGVPFIVILATYKWRRRHLSMYENIEDFLRSDNNNIMPIRYSYKDIKSITEGFNTKLGNGGYGSVFRGKLRSGRLVAVKLLNDNAKSNGQDFINEVATIGRIHHVNVVQLIGFCVEGSKRALIYELMENGSLEKYIFSDEQSPSSLSCEKLYAISLGVARGIEYLHNGCDMKILHFDIKPHNILLDHNFNPKVSDFGLARLCPTDKSIVSLTAARGTFGYMAPELFYRNVGTISYKADVYSFGMLLMEIASRRKNLNALTEHSSQLYFPFYVYDLLHDGREIAIENDSEEETKLAKKMMIVALWCIQTRPNDRPSMDKVVEMLQEQDDEGLLLQLPPKPYFYTQDHLPTVEDVDGDHTTSSSSFSDISVSHDSEERSQSNNVFVQ